MSQIRVATAIERIRGARENTLRLMSDFTTDEWFWHPPSFVTHLAWQIGHIAYAQYCHCFLWIRGRRPEDQSLLSRQFIELFEMGSVPVADGRVYPPIEEISHVLNAVHVRGHDAARPCVTLTAINNLCTTLCNDDVGGILAVSVSDTLKQVDANNSIVDTIDRRSLWQAQTPQLFRYKLLHDCLSQTLARHEIITDEASAVELCGYSPKVVEGRNDNIKITRPDDLPLAAFILHLQENRMHEQENNL